MRENKIKPLLEQQHSSFYLSTPMYISIFFKSTLDRKILLKTQTYEFI